MYNIYTDGSCYPNPGGNGGWAFVIIKDNELVYKVSGKAINTTNNRMETEACIKALEYCKTHNILNPCIYSDSMLIVRYTSKGQGKKNKDLIEVLNKLRKETKPIFKWIKGHSQNEWNELADSLASYKS